MTDTDRSWDQPDQPGGFWPPPASPDPAAGGYGSPGYAGPGYAQNAGPAAAPQGPADPFPQPTIQQAYQQGQEDMRRRLTTPRMTGYRIACGIVWAFWALAFFIGSVSSFASGSAGTGLLLLVLAGLAGWYDFRIWTLRARRLTFFIIF